MRTKKQSHIFRAIAIYFLLFTVADLATPHLCGEELDGFPKSASIAEGAETATEHSAISSTAADRHEDESSSPAPLSEDCFCCCSHILPGAHFTVGNLTLQTMMSEPSISFLPTAPSNKPFRPPRLS
jgi:hypothetical protein